MTTIKFNMDASDALCRSRVHGFQHKLVEISNEVLLFMLYDRFVLSAGFTTSLIMAFVHFYGVRPSGWCGYGDLKSGPYETS